MATVRILEVISGKCNIWSVSEGDSFILLSRKQNICRIYFIRVTWRRKKKSSLSGISPEHAGT